MSAVEMLLDGLLVLLTLSVAALALYHPRIFANAVLFIVHGLLMSLIWLRLSAPDVALAEAAIGAGITGVLLIGTLARLAGESAAGGGDANEPRDDRHDERRERAAGRPPR